MAGGNGVKIGIIVACLILAGVILVMTGGDPEPKDLSGGKPKHVICVDEPRVVEMDQAAYKEALKNARNIPVGDDEGPRTRMSVSMVKVVDCPECGPGGALPAIYCAACEGYVPSVTMDGERGKCPEDCVK